MGVTKQAEERIYEVTLSNNQKGQLESRTVSAIQLERVEKSDVLHACVEGLLLKCIEAEDDSKVLVLGSEIATWLRVMDHIGQEELGIEPSRELYAQVYLPRVYSIPKSRGEFFQKKDQDYID